LSPEELDNRLRCLPLAHGVRHFKNGISTLSQISGKERKEMACVLLACLVGKVSKETMITFRSLLDFIYLAQYPTHDDDTLRYLEKALQTFHANKDVLIKLGIRDDFNIPKIHSLLHYKQAIRLFGTTDNYNTEMFERLHIEFAKDAWRATNHRDEFPQMVRWITRNEKMALYEAFQKERSLEDQAQDEEDEPEDGDPGSPADGAAAAPDGNTTDVVESTMGITIAKYPPAPQQHLAAIQDRHHAPGFTAALAQYINVLQPQELRLTRGELSQTWLPFTRLDVYHKYKFKPCSLHDGKEEVSVIKAIPASGRTGRKDRFDTAIVLDTEDAESTGVQGTRVGRVKVLFKLPRILPQNQGGRPAPAWWPTGPLAYVEWYTKFAPAAADPAHLMYSVRKQPLAANGLPQGKIIPLSQIRQSCQLIPTF
ncbi:hypothetical protein FOMPIDRAFT_1098984, partial [Fomitopsis schrenkii]